MARVERVRRLSGRVAAVFAVALVAAGVPGTPARAKAEEYVQYYAVRSESETLAQVAERFLDSSARWDEIFNLNTGRRQPAGGALADPNKLKPGWYLVVPWDAAGANLEYGSLPTTTPTSSTGSSGSTGSNGSSGSTGSNGSTGNGSGSTGGPAGGPLIANGQATSPGGPASPGASRPNPAMVPKTPPSPPPASAKCVAATAASKSSNWATARLAANQAWRHSRGGGQLVAIVDSGVDGRAVQLSGRVAIGANIVTGDGRGDTDCLGTGTAMAGLVAAEPVGDRTFAGVAPEAVVMPVRVVTDGKTAGKADHATAIEVAVSAGATVIALGSHVDITDKALRPALETAVKHNIVVVAGAPPKNAATVELPAGVILVGGVAANGRTAAEYAPQSVDVVAPGMNVTSIGVNGAKTFTGSGTQYAVALTAGAAALVRSSHPELSAGQVTHRLTVTSDKMAGAQPHPRYGHGMINLVASITRELPEEATKGAAGEARGRQVSGGDSGRIAFLSTMLAGLVLSTLLVFRFRRTMRQSATDDADRLDGDWPAAPAAEDSPAPEPTGAAAR